MTPDVAGQDPDLYCSGSSKRLNNTGALSVVNVKSERWGSDSVSVSPMDSWVPSSPADVYCTVLGYTAVNFTLQLVDQSPSALVSASPSAPPSGTGTASATRVGSPSGTATRTGTATNTATRSGSAPATPSRSSTASVSASLMPAPSNGAVATLAVGGQASGTLQTNEKHYYAFTWAPPAGAQPLGLQLTLKPLSLSADPDLAASQFGPSPSDFVPQLSSANGAGATDSLALYTGSAPLSAVLSSGSNPPTLFVRVTGYSAGSYLLTSAYIAASPSPTTPGSPTASPSAASALPSRPPTGSATRSPTAVASGASQSRTSTRTASSSGSRTPDPTPSPAVTVKARIAVSGSTVGASAVLVGSFAPGDLPHYLDFRPPSLGTWTFKLSRTAASGDVDLCVNAAGFRALVLGPNGVSNWCASAGLAPGAVEELNVTVTRTGASVSLGAGTRRRLVNLFRTGEEGGRFPLGFEAHADADADAEMALAPRLLQMSASPSPGPVSLFVRVANAQSSTSTSYQLGVAMTAASPDSGTGGGDPASSTPSLFERYRWWFIGGGAFVAVMIILGCVCGCACTRKRKAENRKTQAEAQAQAQAAAQAATGGRNEFSTGATATAAVTPGSGAPAQPPARAVYAGLPPAYAPGAVPAGGAGGLGQLQQIEMQQMQQMQVPMQTPYGAVNMPHMSGYPAAGGYPGPLSPTGYPPAAGYAVAPAAAAAYPPPAYSPGYPVAPGQAYPSAPGQAQMSNANALGNGGNSGLRPQVLAGLTGYASPSLQDARLNASASGPAYGGAGGAGPGSVPLASYPPMASGPAGSGIGSGPGGDNMVAASRGGIPSSALPFAGQTTGEWELDPNRKRMPSGPLPMPVPVPVPTAMPPGAVAASAPAYHSSPAPTAPGPALSLFGPPASASSSAYAYAEDEDPRAGAVMRGVSVRGVGSDNNYVRRPGQRQGPGGDYGDDDVSNDVDADADADVPIAVAPSQRFHRPSTGESTGGSTASAASLSAQQAAAIASTAATGDAAQIAVAAAAALAEANAGSSGNHGGGAYPAMPLPSPGSRVADL